MTDDARSSPAEAFRPPAPAPKRMLTITGGDLLAMLPETCFDDLAIRVRRPRHSILLVSDPALVKQVLVDEAGIFPKSDRMVRAFEPLIGGALLIANGERWRRQRAMLDAAFEHLRVRSVFAQIRAAAEDFAAAAEPGELDLGAAMSALALDVIYRTIFSRAPSPDEAREVHASFQAYQALTPEANPLALFGRPSDHLPDEAALREASGRIRGIVGTLVDRRLAEGPGRQDVLQAIVEARDPDGGPGFSRDEIVDQVAMLFLAGHETSAAALTWTLFILSQAHDHADALREEARAAAPGRWLAAEEVARLPVTRRACLEALRLYPPAGFLSRTAAEPVTLGEHRLEAGSLVVASPWIIHRHRALWPDADLFIPERFSKERERSVVPGAYVPFGWGARICTGRALSLVEVPFLVAEINRRFAIEVADPRAVEPVSRLTIQPKAPIRCRLEPRRV